MYQAINFQVAFSCAWAVDFQNGGNSQNASINAAILGFAGGYRSISKEGRPPQACPMKMGVNPLAYNGFACPQESAGVSPSAASA